MNTFHLSLMRREAEQRLADADRLDAAAPVDGRSDSAHLLRLLDLELLLKIVHIVTVGRPSRSGDKYDAIFQALPESVQRQLLALAGERIGLRLSATTIWQFLRNGEATSSAIATPMSGTKISPRMNIARLDGRGSTTERPLKTPHSATTPRNCLDSSTRFAALRTRLAKPGSLSRAIT